MTHYYNLAYKEAKRGKHSRYRMGAVVVRGGAVISKGHNIERPVMKLEDVICRGQHAEKRALRANVDYSGAYIFVVRIKPGMSRPCEECMGFIRNKGIKKIFYLDCNGEHKSEKVS